MATTLIQMKTLSKSIDGMSYLVKADDGSILVIDGGAGDGDALVLLEHLRELTGQEIPTVDYWILTHAHADHFLCCVDMARNYADRIKVKRLCYHFPEEAFTSRYEPAVLREIGWFMEAIPAFGKVEVLTPLRGDCWHLGSTRIEFLYTPLDFPEDFEGRVSFNDSSLVFRLSDCGQTVLFLGDIEQAGNLSLLRNYGDSLQSEVCQVAHHGYQSSTAEFYDVVNPKILLWPASQASFDDYMARVAVNRHLVYELSVKEIVLAGRGSRRMMLPVRVSDAPYLPPLQVGKRKDMKADYQIPRLFSLPSVDDPEDPRWENCLRIPFDNVQRMGSEERVEAFACLCHTNEELFLRVEMKKENLPSNPLQHSTLDCNCFRVYLAEEPVADYNELWESYREKPGYFSNLKLYCDPKQIHGSTVENTMPELCQSRRYSFEGKSVICARIRWELSHREGDLIGLLIEANAVDEAEGQRKHWLSFVKGEDAKVFYTNPAGLPLFALS